MDLSTISTIWSGGTFVDFRYSTIRRRLVSTFSPSCEAAIRRSDDQMIRRSRSDLSVPAMLLHPAPARQGANGQRGPLARGRWLSRGQDKGRQPDSELRSRWRTARQ